MLFANLGIIAGVYLGKQILDKLRSRNKTVAKETHSKSKVLLKSETNSLYYAKIGGGTTLIISAAYYYYAPLKLLSVGLLSYTALPIFQKTFQSLSNEGKLKNHGYSSLTMILLLGTGSYLAAALNSVIYHVSEHIVEKSRKDSACLTTQVYQQVPEMVWIADKQGVERQIELTQLQVGDIVMVTTGEVIPIDGFISIGRALVDQQALTGEANPMEKHQGDKVMTSTIVLSGRIGILARDSGEETCVNQLNKLLHQTEAYKTSLQLKGEEWSNQIALPVMITSALIIPFAGTASALALLFSVPMNTVRSMLSMHTLTQMQRINEKGALIKDGRVLEELPRIDTILFDKTGTLTQTQSEVATIISCGEYDQNTILSYAAAAEQRLDHPIAKAIVAKAKQQHLAFPVVTQSSYDLGLGVTVSILGHQVHVGSQRFIQQVTKSESLPEKIQHYMQKAQGHSFVLIAIDHKIQGLLELYPEVRPEIPTLIKILKQRGFKHLAIVSGDQTEPTQRLSQALNMDAFYAEVLPQDKAALIRKLQDEGHHVCFIGDGINDAMALKQANVSVCLQSASPIANEMAQIVMLNESLAPLGNLFDISTELHKKLSNSLYFWVGFGATNALAIPLLGFGPFQSSLFYTMAYSAGLLHSSDRDKG